MRDEREQAFAEFAARHAPALLTTAHQLTGNAERARELAERALARLHRRWSGLDPDRAEAELERALVSAVLGGRTRPAEVGPPASGGSLAPDRTPAAGGADDTAEPAGPDDVVWQALDSLPVRRRAVLVLRHAAGLTDEQVAHRLGVRPQLVAAEASAGLAGLRRILRDRGAVQGLLARTLADPALGLPVPGDLVERARARASQDRRRQRSRYGAGLAAVAAVAGLVVGLLVVPNAVANRAARGQSPVPATTPAGTVGLVGWPARGELVGASELLRAAWARWERDAAEPERPVRDVSVLYAGELAGASVVVLQGLDRAGRPRVAEVTGPGPGTDRPERRLRLLRSDELGPDPAVLAILPAPGGAGPPGELRLLAAPPTSGAAADLYVAELGGDGRRALTDPLRRLRVEESGLSEPLTPAGPSTSWPLVALTRQAPSPSGPAARGAVQASGRVSTDQLTMAQDAVELGSPTLLFGNRGLPTYGWYADAVLVAGRVGSHVAVAPLGPDVGWTVATGPGRGHAFRSRAYEVSAAGGRWLAFVARLDGRPLCLELSRLGPTGRLARLPVAVRRCLASGYRTGLVQVLVGPGVAAVRVTLARPAAGSAPRGARPTRSSYRRTFTAAAARAAPGAGYTAVDRLVGDFPTGAGTVEVLDMRGRVVARAGLPPYQP